MELLVLLGLTMAVGTFAILDDDDGSESHETSSQEPQDSGNGAARTDADDDIIGSHHDDSIFARGGDDVVEGRGGDDRLFGQDGNDFITGGAGDDWMRGGDGNDAILDHEGADTVFGDLGDDTIVATSAMDGEEIAAFARGVANGSITELDGFDALLTPDTDTDDDADSIQAGLGNDVVLAGSGDTVSLGEGEDTLGIGDWIEAGDDPVIFTDFSKLEDIIVYSHDGGGGEPELTLEETQDQFGDPDDALLYANGVLVARIEGAGGLMTLDDVSIVDRTQNDPVLGL
ncbi:calcium-binding protein [Leisingera methylohalidivorans]|uniref:Type I secretion protein n=1 Tax=Leisingera methylohalidivorans DSM 14336 TaxID=999552 RepID=V9VYJ4_9RHOB|nr:calcium-binding protein [Leisingera methylohalidivorans]AHD03028.1 hypothetical protein METH_08960 [Leisingera methylohalidivorans DSM 14336]